MSIGPDLVCWNTVIDAFAKSGRMTTAVVWFDKLEALGQKNSSLRPDICSFGSIIQGYSDVGDVENAKVWFEKLKLTGISVSNATFNSALRRLLMRLQNREI